jgi:hypothetical protein
MHMHFSKKGDLAISTNAIVILIIAVIMLGLIIGFVTRGFESVEDRFLSQVGDSEAPAGTPTSSQPITLSRKSVTVNRGELAGLKVNILNTGTEPLESVKPTIECLAEESPVADAGEQVFPKDIDVNKYADFVYYFKITDDAPGNTYLCRMQAVAGNQETSIKATEFTVVVEE